MGLISAGSYDVITIVTEAGLQRLVRSILLEGPGFNGLPYETPLDGGGVLRTELATVTFAPSRVVPGIHTCDTSAAPTNESAPDSIGIRMPFTDSYMPPASCINGAVTIVLPIFDSANRLQIDLTGIRVWISLPHDDGTPGSLLTVAGGLCLAKLQDPNQPNLAEVELDMAAQIVADPPPMLDALLSNAGLGALFGLDRCPVGEAVSTGPPDPVAVAPTAPVGVNAAFRLADSDPDVPTNMLVIKSKVSPISMAAGTLGDPVNLDVSDAPKDRDVTIVVGQRYLAEEVFPSRIMRALLDKTAKKRKDDLLEELEDEDQIAAWEEELFTLVVAEVLADDAWEAETLAEIEEWIASNMPNLTPAEHEAEVEEQLQARRDVETTVRFNARIDTYIEDKIRDAVAADYAALTDEHFDFPLTVSSPVPLYVALPPFNDIVQAATSDEDPPETETPETPNGQIDHVELTFPQDDDDRVVRLLITFAADADGYSISGTVELEWEFEAVGGVVELALRESDNDIEIVLDPAYFGLEPASSFVQSFIPSSITSGFASAFSDMMLEPLAASEADDQIDSLAPGGGTGLGDSLDSLVVYRVRHDDLEIAGDFRIGHNGAVVELKSILFEQPIGETNVGELVLERPDGGGIAIANGQISPVGDVSIADLGMYSMIAAANIGQADLRHGSLTFASSTIALEEPEEPEDIAGLPGWPGPSSFASGVQVVGLRTSHGGRGVLRVYQSHNGFLVGYYREYRQAVPGAHLAIPGPADKYLTGETLMVCVGSKTYAEAIGGPDLPGGAPFGSIRVGVTTSWCNLDFIARAETQLLRKPVSVEWSIVTEDGSEHPAFPAPGGGFQAVANPDGPNDVELVLTPADPGDPSDPDDDVIAVTIRLTVDQEDETRCRVRSTGPEGAFTLRIRVNESCVSAGAPPYIDEREIEFRSRKTDFFGFDHWLDRFEKVRAFLAKDPLAGGDPAPIDPEKGLVDPGLVDPGLVDPSLVDPGRDWHRRRRARGEVLIRTKGLPGTDMTRNAARSIHSYGMASKSELRRGVRRPASGAVTIDGIATAEAKLLLVQQVRAGLSSLAGGRDRATVAAFERQVDKALRALPSPTELLARSERAPRHKHR